MEEVELYLSGIPMANGVGDALRGNIREVQRHLLLLGQFAANQHLHAHTVEDVGQQFQSTAGAWGLVLPEVPGQALGKGGQQGLVRLFVLPQGAQQQADPLSQHIVDAALSPQKLLHIAGGL